MNLQIIKNFLNKKGIEISVKRYFIDGLSQMAQAVFASLLIGLIFKTFGEQCQNLFANNPIFSYCIYIGDFAMKLVGPAIGVAVAWSLKAPPLVLYTSGVTGALGALAGGEAAAFLSALVGAECGKLISKETKIDILVTPGVTLLAGCLTATLAGPLIHAIMSGIGMIIIQATELQPFFMGIIVSVIVGLVLTSPLSSTALCIILGLTGISAGAAAIGCCTQMVGFAAISFKDCKIDGLMAMGLGSSMFQLPNIIKNPWILLPTTLASAIIAPLGTCIFKTTNTPAGAGMGTCGFVGQIFTFTEMGLNLHSIVAVLLLHFVLPIALCIVIDKILRKLNRIKDGDYYLNL